MSVSKQRAELWDLKMETTKFIPITTPLLAIVYTIMWFAFGQPPISDLSMIIMSVSLMYAIISDSVFSAKMSLIDFNFALTEYYARKRNEEIIDAFYGQPEIMNNFLHSGFLNIIEYMKRVEENRTIILYDNERQKLIK